MAFYSRLSLLVLIVLITFPLAFAQSESTTDPLVQVLVKKGVLSAEEARLITVNATPAEQRDRLAVLLRDKGVISTAEFDAVRAVAPTENNGVRTLNAGYKTAPPATTGASPSRWSADAWIWRYPSKACCC